MSWRGIMGSSPKITLSTSRESFFSDSEKKGDKQSTTAFVDDAQEIKEKKPQIPEYPFLQLDIDNELGSTAKTSVIARYLKDIEDDMAKVINSVNQSSSIFSKIAKAWSSLALWKKILLGGAAGTLVAGAIALSIMAHLIVATVAIAIFTAITIGIFALMENHYSSEADNAAKLNGLFAGFGRMLKSVIFALDEVREGFAKELDGLTSENKRLSDNINDIDGILSSSYQVSASISTLVSKTYLLTSELDELGLGSKQGNGEFNSLCDALFDAKDTSGKLRALLLQRDQCIEILAEQIKSFEMLNQSLKERDIEAKAQIEILNTAIQRMSKIQTSDQNEQETFTKRLEEIFSRDDESLNVLKEHYREATKELATKAEDLEKIKMEYTHQLKRHAAMLKKQEGFQQEYEQQFERVRQLGLDYLDGMQQRDVQDNLMSMTT
jgi:hypothetical protein